MKNRLKHKRKARDTDERLTGAKPHSISISERLMERIDKRAEFLGLNRSQYIAVLAKKDLQNPNDPITIHPDEPKQE